MMRTAWKEREAGTSETCVAVSLLTSPNNPETAPGPRRQRGDISDNPPCMHPWHDVYVDDHLESARPSRRHRSADGQQEQVRARQGDPGCCGWTACCTARSTTRPITASCPAPSATTATRSTRWSSGRSRCTR